MSRPRKFTTEQAQEILERFQAGTTSLRAERERLGLSHNGVIRATLRRLVGPEEYTRLMALNNCSRGRPRRHGVV
jgi:broad specificity phosphatase PhoE